MSFHNIFNRFAKDVDELLNGSLSEPPENKSAPETAPASGVPTDPELRKFYNKLVKQHNGLRAEFDAVKKDLEQTKNSHAKLRSVHNGLAKELGAVKKDLKSDVARIERRLRDLLG